MLDSASDQHCSCCVRRLGFGPRRNRVLFLTVKHPELDQPEFCGELHVQTDRNGQARGYVRPREVPPLIEVEHVA